MNAGGGEEAPGPVPGGEGTSHLVLLILAAGGVYLLGLLLAPFLPALVTSAVLAALVYPGHERVRRAVDPPSAAALLSTVVVFFLVLIPMLGVSLMLVNQLGTSVDWLAREAAELLGPGGRLRGWLEVAAGQVGVDPASVSVSLSEQLQQVVGTMAGRTLSFLSGLGGWLLQAGAALFTLFYLLRDGEKLVGAVQWLIPLEGPVSARLLRRARDVTYATVYGNVVVAVVQGALGGLAFWLVGLPAAALWGTLMGLLSLLPAVSAPLVWAPAAIILLAEGEVARGLGLLAFGALVISTVDNYLRAVLVSDRAHLHPLVVFFSVLGGLFAFGAVGLFVGPVLFVMALSVIEMARVAMGPPGSGRPPAGAGLLAEGALSVRADGDPGSEDGTEGGAAAAETDEGGAGG